MKRISLVISGLIFVFSAFSAKVEWELASKIAVKYLSGLGNENIRFKDITEISNENYPTQYIINLAPEGWVIIAADDRIKPVLAYSNEGSFILDSIISPDVKSWINGYSVQISSVVEDNIKSKNSEWDKLQHDGYVALKSRQSSVAPILDIAWDQVAGWNNLCPEDEDGPGGHVRVGCVAVAMAQAMYNVKFEAPLAGAHRYVHDTYGAINIIFETKDPFDWAAMAKTKPNKENQRLLYYCAVAISTDFGPKGSASLPFKIIGAMKEYFGYSSDLKYYERYEFVDNDWKNLIKSELDKSNVLVYSGIDEIGHSFNIDGYDINDYFHINWGWSGKYNGYYSIDNLNPGGFKFDNNQSVIVGIADTYYGPTDITLSSKEVYEKIPAGSFVCKVIVKDNSAIDTFTYKLDGGPDFPSGVKEAPFYIENDSLKTKYIFDASIKNEYVLNIHVKDQQGYDYTKAFIINIVTANSISVGEQMVNSYGFTVYYNKKLNGLILKSILNKKVDFELIDLNGKKVIDRQITEMFSVINVNHLRKGIYLIHLSSDDNSEYKKILLN
ncbi:thiol protease/hemagglutinin PrtT [Saccharicrinis sp. FJH2]|uniref:thiol protease/hemagglutinin PrtT n=1 Tax=Saccharicrinis sp. FJH65 TaxID=3344659 RepID=UPI0035F4B344